MVFLFCFAIVINPVDCIFKVKPICTHGITYLAMVYYRFYIWLDLIG